MYVCEVVQREAVIGLDWNDFAKIARVSRPSFAVKVDDPCSWAQLTETAFDEVGKRIKGTLTDLIIVISLLKGHDILMEEAFEMSEKISVRSDEDVSYKWCLQQVEDMPGERCITIYAFEKQRATADFQVFSAYLANRTEVQ